MLYTSRSPLTFISGENLLVSTDVVNAAVGVKAAGTLTLDTNPADTDTMTVGAKVYTFQTTLTDVNGNIQIGASAALTQANIVAAFDLSGTPGTDYALLMTAHPTVDIAAFAGNAAVLTAKTAGSAGNAIATTETFTAGTNVFDDVTLGTTVLGEDSSPARAKVAVVHVEAEPIRVEQGTDPSSTVGRVVAANTMYEVLLDGTDLRMIKSGATDAPVYVAYYGHA